MTFPTPSCSGLHLISSPTNPWMQIPIISIHGKCPGLIHKHQLYIELLSSPSVGAGKGGLWICLMSLSKIHQLSSTTKNPPPVHPRAPPQDQWNQCPIHSFPTGTSEQRRKAPVEHTALFIIPLICSRADPEPQKADPKSTAGMQLCILQIPHSAMQAQSSHRNFSLLPT